MSLALYQAALVSLDQQFNAPASMTLLDAARAAGITLPSSCRNGTCRTCRCRLRCGEVHYHIAWPGLSLTEKEDGYVLPCVAYPLSDVLMDEPRAVFNAASPR